MLDVKGDDMPMMPSRDHRSFKLVKRHSDYGPELMAFYESPINGWCPMISCWAISDPEGADVQEDQISVNGMHFAYCISDDRFEDYDDAAARMEVIEDPSDCDMPTAMMVLGILTQRVI